MLERRVSSNNEVKEKYQKAGVVVFISNLDREILLLRENEGNQITGKNVGDYSVLCETSEEGETWDGTLIRGFREELGIDPEQSNDCFGVNLENSYLGESQFVDGVLARVAIVYFIGDKRTFPLPPEESEVALVGWFKPEDLDNFQLRQGVRKILNECLEADLLTPPQPISELLLLTQSNLRNLINPR